MREDATTKRGASEIKMLIVDDKEGNLYMLDSLLKSKGYAVASGLKVKVREKAAFSPL